MDNGGPIIYSESPLSLSLSLLSLLKSVSMHSEGETTSKMWSKRDKTKKEERGSYQLIYRYMHILCTLDGFTVIVTISRLQLNCM